MLWEHLSFTFSANPKYTVLSTVSILYLRCTCCTYSFNNWTVCNWTVCNFWPVSLQLLHHPRPQKPLYSVALWVWHFNLPYRCVFFNHSYVRNSNSVIATQEANSLKRTVGIVECSFTPVGPRQSFLLSQGPRPIFGAILYTQSVHVQDHMPKFSKVHSEQC